MLLALADLLAAVNSIELNRARVADGMERAQVSSQALLVPDFTTRWRDMERGLIKSATMAFAATDAGTRYP